MITLNLTATTTEEKVLKEYLEQNISEILADKINNGVPVEKDGKHLISRKTLADFMKFATEEAKKQAEKGATSACVHSDVVFGWAVHYFEEDSILGTLYNEDGTEYKNPKPAPKAVAKKTTNDSASISTPKNQEPVGQLTMFDLMDESAHEGTPTDEVIDDAVINIAEKPNYTIIEETGEIIELAPEADTKESENVNPYADMDLMYKLYMLLDQQIEIVK